MKIKIWLDEQNRLTNWAYEAEDATVGPTEDGQQIIEADDVSQFFEGHASLVDGKIVADEGYDPANDHPLPGPLPEDKIVSLQQSNDELQSALLELSDLVLSGGGSK
jgi:hypothetical protein